MDETIVDADTSTVDLTIDSLKAEDGNIDPAKLQAALDERNNLKKTNPKLYARAKAAEEKIKPPISNPEPSADILATVAELKLAEEKRRFGHEHSLSPEETDKVFQLTNNKPTKETLEDEFVKGGIEKIRAKKRVETNTPAPSGRSSTFKGKPFAELSREDRKANFGSYMKNLSADQ
jgi:hypothetical protein